MTKKIKHFKRWLALLLAVVLVGGICIYSNSGSLWATEGVTSAPEEGAASDTSKVVSEPQEIILYEEDSKEESTEETEVQLGDEATTEVAIPEDESKENMEAEEDIINEEIDSSEVEEEISTEELQPEVKEKEEVERSVKVVSSLEGVESVEEGTPITLTAELTGFDDVEYEIQWQRSVDGSDWEDVDGANDIRYTFDITEETDGYLWRVGVFISEA